MPNSYSDIDGWTEQVGRIRAAVAHAGGPTAVAKTSGLSRRTINAYMVGETSPSSGRLLALAKGAGVRPEWLLLGEGAMLPNIAREVSAPYRSGPTLTPAKRIILRALEAELEGMTDEKAEAWFIQHQKTRLYKTK